MKNILLVDDEPEILSLLDDYLTSIGYRCYLARNGLDAIKLLQTEKIDLVISDYLMPEINGLDVVQFLNDYKHPVPVIWLSGFADEKDYKKAWDLGLVEFIQKPVQLTAIKKAVDTALALGSDYVRQRQKKDKKI